MDLVGGNTAAVVPEEYEHTTDDGGVSDPHHASWEVEPRESGRLHRKNSRPSVRRSGIHDTKSKRLTSCLKENNEGGLLRGGIVCKFHKNKKGLVPLIEIVPKPIQWALRCFGLMHDQCYRIVHEMVVRAIFAGCMGYWAYHEFTDEDGYYRLYRGCMGLYWLVLYQLYYFYMLRVCYECFENRKRDDIRFQKYCKWIAACAVIWLLVLNAARQDWTNPIWQSLVGLFISTPLELFEALFVVMLFALCYLHMLELCEAPEILKGYCDAMKHSLTDTDMLATDSLDGVEMYRFHTGAIKRLVDSSDRLEWFLILYLVGMLAYISLTLIVGQTLKGCVWFIQMMLICTILALPSLPIEELVKNIEMLAPSEEQFQEFLIFKMIIYHTTKGFDIYKVTFTRPFVVTTFWEIIVAYTFLVNIFSAGQVKGANVTSL